MHWRRIRAETERRDFTKDGLSARQEGKASVQVVQGGGQAMGARRSSKFLLCLLLVIGLEAAGDAFFNDRISL